MVVQGLLNDILGELVRLPRQGLKLDLLNGHVLLRNLEVQARGSAHCTASHTRPLSPRPSPRSPPRCSCCSVCLSSCWRA